MNCHEARQHWNLYHDSEGDAELHFQVNEHLAICPDCAQWFSQTNVVRISRGPNWASKRQVFIPIFRRPGSNTIEVVEGVKERVPDFLSRLPVKEGRTDSGLNLDVVADQSVFVRNAIKSLTWEGILGAVLASLMVMIFIGSVRSTVIIALTIPLSALVAVIGLYFTGNTLNAMTLDGLALVMGRLVDDPIVDIENTFRHLAMGKSPKQAALDSAMEIAMPVLVATLTTVVVFFPVMFLVGMGKYLFTPMALSVTFAMFASYLLSRTLSPAFCACFLKAEEHDTKRFLAVSPVRRRLRAAQTCLHWDAAPGLENPLSAGRADGRAAARPHHGRGHAGLPPCPVAVPADRCDPHPGRGDR